MFTRIFRTRWVYPFLLSLLFLTMPLSAQAKTYVFSIFSHSLQVYDSDSGQWVAKLLDNDPPLDPMEPTPSYEFIAAHPIDHHLYLVVSRNYGKNTYLVEVDPQDLTIQHSTDLGDINFYDLAFSPEGKKLYLLFSDSGKKLAIFDTGSRQITQTQPTTRLRIYPSRDGSKIYAGDGTYVDHLDVQTLQLVAPVKDGADFDKSVFNKTIVMGDSEAYLFSGNGLNFVDLASDQEIDYILDANQEDIFSTNATLSKDGKKLYIYRGDLISGNSLLALDTDTHQIIQENLAAVYGNIGKLTLSPDEKYVYLYSRDEQEIYVHDRNTLAFVKTLNLKDDLDHNISLNDWAALELSSFSPASGDSGANATGGDAATTGGSGGDAFPNTLGCALNTQDRPSPFPLSILLIGLFFILRRRQHPRQL